jgi:hypothetical protein
MNSNPTSVAPADPVIVKKLLHPSNIWFPWRGYGCGSISPGLQVLSNQGWSGP